jgi:hypothetical protein
MTEYKCIKCNTLIEICCDSSGEEPGDTRLYDKFICENCILHSYITDRVICRATGREFKMIPWLEELIAEIYTFKSLRNYSGKW